MKNPGSSTTLWAVALAFYHSFREFFSYSGSLGDLKLPTLAQIGTTSLHAFAESHVIPNSVALYVIRFLRRSFDFSSSNSSRRLFIRLSVISLGLLRVVLVVSWSNSVVSVHV